MTESKREKIDFINEINTILPKYQRNIESVRYEIYDDEGYPMEFLVVNYNGGARSIICCNGNSISAIFAELSKVLDNGDYSNESYYSNFIKTHELMK